jgi:hypothetical protein
MHMDYTKTKAIPKHYACMVVYMHTSRLTDTHGRTRVYIDILTQTHTQTQLTPHGTTFNKEIVIDIPITGDIASLECSSISVYRKASADSGSWSKFDEPNCTSWPKTIRFKTTTFSLYAVGPKPDVVLPKSAGGGGANNVGVIVGAVIGSVAGAILIGVVIWLIVANPGCGCGPEEEDQDPNQRRPQYANDEEKPPGCFGCCQPEVDSEVGHYEECVCF